MVLGWLPLLRAVSLCPTDNGRKKKKTYTFILCLFFLGRKLIPRGPAADLPTHHKNPNSGHVQPLDAAASLYTTPTLSAWGGVIKCSVLNHGTKLEVKQKF